MRLLVRLFLIALLSALGFSIVVSSSASAATLVSAPKISGDVSLNGTVTVNTGKWRSPGAYKYQWYACSAKYTRTSTSKPSKCSAISGAKSNSFVLTSSQVGKYLVAQVYSGRSYVFTVSTSGIVKAPARIVTAPTVSAPSSPSIGSPVDVSVGTYSATPSAVVNFVSWYECDSANATVTEILPDGCVQKSGASKLHVLSAASLGKYLVAKISAVNSLTTKYFYTASTNQVMNAPVLSTAASYSGTLTVDSVLTGVAATWVGYPTITSANQWYRCSSAVSAAASISANCTAITGETALTHTVVRADLGSHLMFASSASNSKGDAVSATTASALLQSAPVLTDSIGLTGFADVTDMLSISAGDWYAYPALSQTYAWYACDSAHAAGTTLPADCMAIADESNVDLTIGVSLLGKYVLASETTSNTLGSTVLFTATSSAVHIAPKNTVAPVISGSAAVGGSLSVTSGTWDADPSPTFDYQWLRCDS
ncbi:MAG: hypothetical protein ACKOWE_04360, partial [Micrococcales bacterium]